MGGNDLKQIYSYPIPTFFGGEEQSYGCTFKTQYKTLI